MCNASIKTIKVLSTPGAQFDSFGDMQRHILIEHMQKGDVISEEEQEENEHDHT
jgi:hypothetical protein